MPVRIVLRGPSGAQADGNSTGVGNPPGYCYAEQPQWSQYRESSFGHGTFDALNSTHALWSCAPPNFPAVCLARLGWRSGLALHPTHKDHWRVGLGAMVTFIWAPHGRKCRCQLCRMSHKNKPDCYLLHLSYNARDVESRTR